MPLYTDIDGTPRAFTNAERQQQYRDRDPARWARRKRDYRHANSKWQTDAHYLARPFLGWDGEGITGDDGKHRYVMLANSSGARVARPGGLSTVACLDFLLTEAEKHAGSIHVVYGGSYDINMILTDLTRAQVWHVYHNKWSEWNGYRLGWRRGKSLYVCRVNGDGERIGTGVTLYDVVSFFQCAFVKACDSYLGDRFMDRELIVTNKALRSSFTVDDIPEVSRYNDAELVNLVALMDELRSRLNAVGLRPKRWDGPGAVASALLTRENVKAAKNDCPEPVADAARYAYAGGRFEIVRFGHVDSPVYEYDINSAYPAALRDVPDLNAGTWTHHDSDPGPHPFALYHVQYDGNRMDLPGALFRRDGNGTICYPLHTTGWYWSPEVETAREYCEAGYGRMRVVEAWTFDGAETAPRPFAFIDPLYLKRRTLKERGDGAHVGIKLALNSLYGKLAQQVGWERTRDGLRIPPFHQLEWAGYTTSHARATVLRAVLPCLESVIAFETDAVFTSEPLDVPLSGELGAFGETRFTDLTYVQSGVYFGRLEDGTMVERTRGVDRGTLTRDDVLTGLAQERADDRAAHASLTRFVGAGVALAQSWARWQRWERMDKRMTLEPTGKRIHTECDACAETGPPITLGAWHGTHCPMLNRAHSCAFPVEWINPDPDMDMLAELRESEHFWEDE